MNYWSDAMQHIVTQMKKFYHNYCNKFLLFSYLSFSFKNAALKNECSILHNYIVYGHILTTMYLKEKKNPQEHLQR